MKCNRCGNMMRLDDSDEISRGVFEYYFVCNECDNSCTVNGSTGVIKWYDDDDEFSDLPF